MMGRNWNDWCIFSDGSFKEFGNLLVRFNGSLSSDQVNFVLNDNDVLDASNLEGHEVFSGLWLRACFVGCNH